MNFIVLSPEELKKLLAETVDAAVFAAFKKQKEDTLHTFQETTEILRVTPPTLRSYTRKGLIESTRFGGRILYRQTAIEDAIKTIKKYRTA